MNKPKLVRPKVTKILYVASLLILINALIAGYLLYEFYTLNPEAFCSINETFDCLTVAQTEYAVMFGVPVAMWGLGFYVVLFIGTLGVALKWPFQKLHKRLRPGVILNVMRYLSYFGLLFSLYLTYVELFVIYTICPLCMVQQVLIIVVVLLFVWANTTVHKGLKETKVCEFC